MPIGPGGMSAATVAHHLTVRMCSTAPRAKLFAMLHRDVDSMESMQHIMRSPASLQFTASQIVCNDRWNDYRSTPSISGGDPCNAIACRADLRSSGSHPLSAFGAIDAKVGNTSHTPLFCLFLCQQDFAENGSILC